MKTREKESNTLERINQMGPESGKINQVGTRIRKNKSSRDQNQKEGVP